MNLSSAERARLRRMDLALVVGRSVLMPVGIVALLPVMGDAAVGAVLGLQVVVDGAFLHRTGRPSVTWLRAKLLPALVADDPLWPSPTVNGACATRACAVRRWTPVVLTVMGVVVLAVSLVRFVSGSSDPAGVVPALVAAAFALHVGITTYRGARRHYAASDTAREAHGADARGRAAVVNALPLPAATGGRLSA